VGDINPRGIFIGIWGFKGLLGAIGGYWGGIGGVLGGVLGGGIGEKGGG
jgi:hypothetical protein